MATDVYFALAGPQVFGDWKVIGSQINGPMTYRISASAMGKRPVIRRSAILERGRPTGRGVVLRIHRDLYGQLHTEYSRAVSKCRSRSDGSAHRRDIIPKCRTAGAPRRQPVGRTPASRGMN